jgi:nicotinamide-nucleotide amidase
VRPHWGLLAKREERKYTERNIGRTGFPSYHLIWIFSMITAEIIAVGSELLHGGRTDTNSVFLADLLSEQGIDVRFKVVVGDSIDDICQVLSQSVRRARIVLVTGGLGPTVDDVTRESIAKFVGKPLRRRPHALRALEKRFAGQGRKLTQNQLRQGMFPLGAVLLHNPSGTAPGFCVEWKRSLIFTLPGVSHEAKNMFLESVIPILTKERLIGAPCEKQVIQTFGLIEGIIDDRLRGVLFSHEDPIHLGLLASPLGVSVSLTKLTPIKAAGKGRTGKSKTSSKPQVSLEELMREIKARLGNVVYADGLTTMEEIVGQLLVQRGWTVALAESCTGGLIGHRLTQVAGSSAYMDCSVVCYSNQAKIDLLGVSENMLIQYGAVSAPVAQAMAEGIRTRSGVDVGLSVTGIAGPGGGSPDKPVGLVYVGLATPQASCTKCFTFHGDRSMIKLRSSQGALDVLRRGLLGLPLEDS